MAGWGQFCIDQRLAAALRGDVKKGLFFSGRGALPFGEQIRSVRDLIERLLTLPAGNRKLDRPPSDPRPDRDPPAKP
jgi:nitronate monooxygenase